MFLPETHARPLDLGHDLSRTGRRRKLDAQGAQVLFVHFDTVELLQLLDARLHLIALGGFVTELFDELLRLLYHALLVLVGGHLLLAPFAPQLHIPAVRNFVVIQFAEHDFHRTVGHVVEKCPVVRNEYDGPVVLLQIPLQPLDTLDVEVVGRLVEQKDRRTAKQQFGQLDAHAPPAAELARGTIEIAATEAQSEQRLLYLRLAVVSAENMVTVRGIVQPVEQFLVIGTFIIGAHGNLIGEFGYLPFQRDDLGKGSRRLLHETRGIGHLHLLRQVPHRHVAAAGHRTARGGLLAGNHLEQSTLARTVLTHQTDAVFGIHEQRYVLKQIPAAETDGQVIY